MKLENQVVSLELAKQLKEAGYPQEGLWYWTGDITNEIELRNSIHWSSGQRFKKVYTAPTVAELLGKIPFDNARLEKIVTAYGGKEVYRAKHIIDYKGNSHNEDENNPADAMAKMWLYLKKEKLL